jgi:hypothetical protein
MAGVTFGDAVVLGALAADPAGVYGDGATYFNTTRRVHRTYEATLAVWRDTARTPATRVLARVAFR